MPSWRVSFAFAFLCLAAGLARAQQANPAARPKGDVAAAEPPSPPAQTVVRDGDVLITERPTGSLPKGAPGSFAVTPDGAAPFIAYSADLRHWAAVGRDDRGDTLFVDGRPGKTYRRIHNVLFTASGKVVCVVGACPGELAGIALPTNKPQGAPPPGETFVVVDGKEGPRFDRILPGDHPQGDWNRWRRGQGAGLTVSPDGNHVAYVGLRADKTRGEQFYVVHDGVEQGPLGGASRLTFSADGKRFAYLRRDTAQSDAVPVVDGVPQPDLAGVDAHSLCFSPDGKSFALAHGGRDTPLEKYTITVRGALNATFPSFGEPFIFTADGKHVVSVPAFEGSDVLAVDGKTIERSLPGATKVKSIDGGTKLMVEFDRRTVFALDGTRLETTEGGPIGPDGKQKAKVSRTSVGTQVTLPSGKTFRVSRLVIIEPVTFTPDGRLVLHAIRGDRAVPRTGATPQTFFIEDRESADYDIPSLESLSFDKGGTHVAWAARRNDKWLFALDLKDLSPRYDQLPRVPLIAEPDGTLRSMAVRDGVVLSVEIKPPAAAPAQAQPKS